MTTLATDFLAALPAYQYDPTQIQPAVLAMLQASVGNNFEIAVDPSNPFVKSIEASVVLASGFMEKNEINTRRQYEKLAQTQQELFLHMSDVDYIGRFATPATTQFNLFMPLDETINRMVFDPATNSNKIVIPRNSYFTVAGTIFSLQYPINISQLSHGGMQIVYDTSKPSPLQTLSTNLVKWGKQNVSGVEWLALTFDVQQFSIISKLGDLNQAKEFSYNFTLDDQFYYARVYYQNPDKTWTEMTTTHSDQVYDIADPTAVLTVVDQAVNVRIPLIYTATGLLKSKLRMDIYQTKGAIQLDLSSYTGNAFGATWQNYDKNDDTIFTAPISAFQQIIPLSDQFVSGGTAPPPFVTLRNRVISRTTAADKVLPITNVQLESALEDIGYDVIRDVDNITTRDFLATRFMPDPVSAKLLTAAAASMETLSVTISDLVQLTTVADNGASVTIKPSTLFRNVNGITTPVPSNQVAQLLTLAPDKLALTVTGAGYTYTPFHYVLDTTSNEFAVRPYYLDAPIVLVKDFVDENDTTQLQVATNAYGVFKTDTGYAIQIVTSSSDAYKAINDEQCQVQLAFVPNGEKDRAYLNGTYQGRDANNERIFMFDLSSTFNISADDFLELTKFLLYTTEPRIVGAALETTFDLLYTTTAVMDNIWVAIDADQLLGTFILPASPKAVTHETLNVHFGDALDTLWARARTVVAPSPYQTYAQDVPAYYTADTYVTDPTTGSSVIIGEDGKPVFTITHHKGDPVLDSVGDPVMQYKAGDVMNDPVTGLPIPIGPRTLVRQINLMQIEGAYWFATDPAAVQYRTDLVNTVLGWLTNDLGTLSGSLLEETRLFFFPKATQGYIDVAIGDSVTTSIAAGQAFVLNLQVPKTTLNDDKLKTQLETATITAIKNWLLDVTLSVTDLITTLGNLYGDDVISFTFSGLGGTLNLAVLSVVDAVNRCSLRKRLEALADGSLVATEDATFNYILHS